MKTFTEKVYDVVRRIPKGYVATYGQVAKIAGYPNAARAVGTAMHKNPDPINIPCYRVVNSKGELTKNFAFGGINSQAQQLKNEGIEVIDYKVNLSKYQWSGIDEK